ncbi:MAG TPA: hypothetical protein PLB91_05555 [Spirochaetales bacterium]|nr:hypothetical protein [Spirochaetales bacterium]HRZ66174.1 hypothetical protein [Spirochaetia bacterium]
MASRSALYPLIVALGLLAAACSSGGGGSQRVGLADPRFGYIAPKWDTKVRSLDMHDYWLSFSGGIVDRRGANYYLLPKSSGGASCSDRFRAASDYFQAWCGVYTVEDDASGAYAINESGEVDIQAILELAQADQNAWLAAYGDTSGSAWGDVTMYSVEEAEIDGCAGWKISGPMNSNVDVGTGNPATGLEPLALPDESLWIDDVGSHQLVSLNGVFYVWHSAETKELNVAYYNGVVYLDKHSAWHNTLPKVQAELEQMARAISVYEE